MLELCTHNPRKKDQAIDLYTTFQWADLCEEVAKLKLIIPRNAQPAPAEPTAAVEVAAEVPVPNSGESEVEVESEPVMATQGDIRALRAGAEPARGRRRARPGPP